MDALRWRLRTLCQQPAVKAPDIASAFVPDTLAAPNVGPRGWASRAQRRTFAAQRHASALEIARDEAVHYGQTLEADRDKAVQYAQTLKADRDKATQYAQTLEADRDKAVRYARSQEQYADKLNQSRAEAAVLDSSRKHD